MLWLVWGVRVIRVNWKFGNVDGMVFCDLSGLGGWGGWGGWGSWGGWGRWGGWAGFMCFLSQQQQDTNLLLTGLLTGVSR